MERCLGELSTALTNQLITRGDIFSCDLSTLFNSTESQLSQPSDSLRKKPRHHHIHVDAEVNQSDLGGRVS